MSDSLQNIEEVIPAAISVQPGDLAIAFNFVHSMPQYYLPIIASSLIHEARGQLVLNSKDHDAKNSLSKNLIPLIRSLNLYYKISNSREPKAHKFYTYQLMQVIVNHLSDLSHSQKQAAQSMISYEELFSIETMDARKIDFLSEVNHAFKILISALPLDHHIDEVAKWDSFEKIESTILSAVRKFPPYSPLSDMGLILDALKTIQSNLKNNEITKVMQELKVLEWKDEIAIDKVHTAMKVIAEQVSLREGNILDQWQSLDDIHGTIDQLLNLGDVDREAIEHAQMIIDTCLLDSDVEEISQLLKHKSQPLRASPDLAEVPERKNKSKGKLKNIGDDSGNLSTSHYRPK